MSRMWGGVVDLYLRKMIHGELKPWDSSDDPTIIPWICGRNSDLDTCLGETEGWAELPSLSDFELSKFVCFESLQNYLAAIRFHVEPGFKFIWLLLEF